ncbi:MAG: hypothetical protein KZQ93_06220 [Candidatus Thiodiazotropha sp. (ex Monitilora ramsayi)]|nr:hypothetical protein [Candidatus Thiodiazotropha sp. (ex Monitilora ramsayi)]
MKAVTIHDVINRGSGSYLTFDLIDILNLFPRRVISSSWSVEGVWCIQKEGEEQEPKFKGQISGKDLNHFATNVNQIIDGVFKGFEEGSKKPWLVIVADDSTLYAVISNEDAVINEIKDKFKVVKESLEWAQEYA